MDPTAHKDPARVRIGWLSALASHSRGLTNVGPNRTACLVRFEADVVPTGELDPAERTPYAVAEKASIQSILAFVVIATTCALAWRGDIDGPTFAGYGLIVLAWYFKGSGANN